MTVAARPCRAKNPGTCKYHTALNTPFFKAKDGKILELSHGQYVVKGLFKTSVFAQTFNTKESSNSYFDGSWEEIETLVTQYQHDFEPGTGSVDGDVILVNVPPENFYTPIVEITDENAHLVEEVEHVRMEGEKPVVTKIVKGQKPPANFVQIVCYRADVLAQDNDRSNEAEWEIIAVNGQKDKNTPMHPTTMLRNSQHDKGGTFRVYSDAEWEEAYTYWSSHAYIQET